MWDACVSSEDLCDSGEFIEVMQRLIHYSYGVGLESMEDVDGVSASKRCGKGWISDNKECHKGNCRKSVNLNVEKISEKRAKEILRKKEVVRAWDKKRVIFGKRALVHLAQHQDKERTNRLADLNFAKEAIRKGRRKSLADRDVYRYEFPNGKKMVVLVDKKTGQVFNWYRKDQ